MLKLKLHEFHLSIVFYLKAEILVYCNYQLVKYFNKLSTSSLHHHDFEA